MTSRKNFLKRLTGTSLIIVALVGTVFLIHEISTTNAAAPVVATITPDNGPIAGGTNITITGSGFKGEYERVEALVFDGNSYIDTGASQLNRDINVRFQMDITDTTTTNMVFGTSNSADAARMSFGRGTGASGYYQGYKGSQASATTYSNRVRAGERNDVTLSWVLYSSSAMVQINGSLIGFTNNYPTTSANIWLGRSSNPAGYFRGYLFSSKIYENGGVDLMYDFVAVKKVGVEEYGMVDMKTGIFYGNAGSGTLTGGSWVDGIFTEGATMSGAISPDASVEVLIDGRPCTSVTINSDTELTCNTPSGLSLGLKDVTVNVTKDNGGISVTETTTVIDGYEYALRLNSVSPKFGDPDETTEIEIEGGVFSTPPEQFESIEGIVFDGQSWIDSGFDQIGSTKVVMDFKYNISTCSGFNMGMLGARSSASTSSFVVWGCTGNNLRTDYVSGSGGTYALSNLGTDTRYSIIKDNGLTEIRNVDGSLKTTVGNATNNIPGFTSPVNMLIGSLSHGGSYGTNGNTVYSSFQGEIYSVQICKDPAVLPADTLYQVDDALCGSDRVLVRDLRPSKRTDGVVGFYDMVTGDFIENAGFGTFTSTGTTTTNELEVPLELDVTFSYLDENDVEQTGTCSDPELLSSTRLRCTMPTSSLPGDGQGKVDLTVYANGVEATAGTADANDFYYGSPMVVETISPNRGPTAGWQTVTITGNNFHPSLNSVPTFDPETDWGNIVITIGGSVCNFELDSNDPTKLADTDHYTNTSITCMTTANAGGISDIEVTLDYYDEIDQEPKTTSYLYGGALDPITGAITSGYLYEGDLIAVSPNIGPTTGGTVVTITGTGFVTDPGVTTQVFFGNVAVATANITVVSYTEIRVITPRSTTTGLKNVTVVQTGQTGYAASFISNPEDGFEYEFVTGTGTLSPNQAYTTGGDTVLLTGTFDSQATAIVTLTSGTGQNQVITTIDPQDINVLSDTQIEVVMPAHTAGVVLVTVNQHNTDIPIANLTYVNPLTITGISPDVGSVNGGTVVTITGTSFVPIGGNAMTILLSGKLDITIGGESCAVAMFTQYTNTSIICTTSARTDLISGLYDVIVAIDTSEATEEDPDPLPVINPNHTDTLEDGFRYVELGISIGLSPVDIGTITPISPYDANSTDVYVQTDNPTGYTVQIKADDSDFDTDNDDWMKCATNQSYKFESIQANGALTNNRWGYNPSSTKPTAETDTWKPITTTNAEFARKPLPSGLLDDGTGQDSHVVWFGAKIDATQPPCSYKSTVMFTAIANN